MHLLTLRCQQSINFVVCVLFLLISLTAQGRAQAQGQKTFTSSSDAIMDFVEAAKEDNSDELMAILGPGSEQIVASGDNIADKNLRDQFVSEFEVKHSLVKSGPQEFTLNVGKTDWPLPIPLVHANNKWFWDGAAGLDEIRYRRIGRNELAAISVCEGVLAAQREYASSSHDGHPPGAYASRIVSDPDTQNGLYWKVPEGAAPSPAGPLLAQANAEGYDTSRKGTPYHGYYYRMLQNSGGFGFLAYPAEYRSSGVMTFIVDQTGEIYQKDLGENTAEIAQQLKNYERDNTWRRVRD